MIRPILLSLMLALPALAQDPFVPMDLNAKSSLPDPSSLRRDWVAITNKRLELAGKPVRVASADAGATAVLLVPDVTRPRHAKPILKGKGEYAALIKSAADLGFTRVVVRNPDTGQEWGARLRLGKDPVLDD